MSAGSFICDSDKTRHRVQSPLAPAPPHFARGPLPLLWQWYLTSPTPATGHASRNTALRTSEVLAAVHPTEPTVSGRMPRVP